MLLLLCIRNSLLCVSDDFTGGDGGGGRGRGEGSIEHNVLKSRGTHHHHRQHLKRNRSGALVLNNNRGRWAAQCFACRGEIGFSESEMNSKKRTRNTMVTKGEGEENKSLEFQTAGVRPVIVIPLCLGVRCLISCWHATHYRRSGLFITF